MSIESTHLARCTDTTAAVILRADSTGPVTLSGNGFETVAGTADTAVTNGITVLEATNLEPGKEYSATVAQGASMKTVTLRTLETNPSEFIAAFSSCWVHSLSRRAIYPSVKKANPSLFFHLGDLHYADIMNNDPEGLGCDRGCEIDCHADNAAYLDNLRAWQRSIRLLPGFQDTFSKVPFIYMYDDHDIFNGFSWTCEGVNNLDDSGDYPGSVPQVLNIDSVALKKEKIKLMYDTARESCTEWMQGNPANNDENIDTYPEAAYFSFRVGKLVEFFVIDSMSYATSHRATGTTGYTEPWASALSATDDTNRTVLGRSGVGAVKESELANDVNAPYQYSWLQTKLLAAQADGVIHKVVMLGRKTYFDSVDNTEKWAAATFERDLFLNWVHANITGFSTCGGDRHIPAVIATQSDAAGPYYNAGYDHVNINACPGGQSCAAGDQGTWGDGTVWRMGTKSSVTDPRSDMPWGADFNVFCKIRVTQEFVEYIIIHIHTNEEIWKGRVLAGTNKLSYESISTSTR